MDSKYDKLADFDNRIIYLFDELDDEPVFHVIHALRKMDAKPGQIRIIMCSVGGYQYTGFALYDVISMCQNHVVIDVFGTCSSMAVAVLQAADYRRASLNSDFLIHSGRAGNDENIKQFELLELAENLKKSNSRYNEIIASRAKFSIPKVEELCTHETYFTAQEALKHSLIDEIIQPIKVYKTKRNKKENK